MIQLTLADLHDPSTVVNVLIMLSDEIARPIKERASCASTESLGVVLAVCESALADLRDGRDAAAAELLHQVSSEVVDEWSLQAELTARIVGLGHSGGRDWLLISGRETFMEIAQDVVLRVLRLGWALALR